MYIPSILQLVFMASLTALFTFLGVKVDVPTKHFFWSLGALVIVFALYWSVCDHQARKSCAE